MCQMILFKNLKNGCVNSMHIHVVKIKRYRIKKGSRNDGRKDL